MLLSNYNTQMEIKWLHIQYTNLKIEKSTIKGFYFQYFSRSTLLLNLMNL